MANALKLLSLLCLLLYDTKDQVISRCTDGKLMCSQKVLYAKNCVVHLLPIVRRDSSRIEILNIDFFIQR